MKPATSHWRLQEKKTTSVERMAYMSPLSYALITPARNEEAYIGGLLQSVTSQSITPRKWVIVNDGSTDGTEAIVKSYQKVHSFIELVNLERGGVRDFSRQATATNLAYERLATLLIDVVGVMDADITFAPEYCSRVLAEFETNRKLGICGGILLEKRG